MLDTKTDVESEPIEQGEEQLTPKAYLSVDLTYEERHRLETWIDGHLNQIKQAMGDVYARLEQERNQLEGNMPGADYPYPGAFRINMPVTKKKVREVVNWIKQAYLDSDPIWAINTKDNSLLQLAMKVEQQLDFSMDNEIESADDLAQCLFESGLHGTGLLTPGWDYQEDVVRDVIQYSGFVTGRNIQESLENLAEVFRFEAEFPNWKNEKELRRIHAQIINGKDVNEEISYTAVVRNKPDHTFVPLKDARVYPHVEGLKGLRRTPLYGFVKQYTRMELEELADEGTIDEDALRLAFPEPLDKENPIREVEPSDVAHLTIRYRLGEGPYARYKVWFEEKTRTVLRIRAFPFWINEPDLIPFYVKQEHPGFFKPGIAYDTLDDHTASNALFNMFLNAVDMANSLRLKAKQGSLAEQMILSRNWSPHMPIPYKTEPTEIDSFPFPTNHMGPMVQAIELMRRNTDENTGTSALQSGRESPTDPSAPAAKTALLLQQVEPAKKEYIRSLEPSFRLLGKWTLMLYYQAIRLGWIESIPGLEDVPPETLKDLANKLYPRALLFEFDRGGRQQRNLLLGQTITNVFGQARPDLVMKVWKIIFSQWDSQWSRIVDTLGFDEVPQGLGQTPVGAGQPSQVTPVGIIQPSGNGSRIAEMIR